MHSTGTYFIETRIKKIRTKLPSQNILIGSSPKTIFSVSNHEPIIDCKTLWTFTVRTICYLDMQQRPLLWQQKLINHSFDRRFHPFRFQIFLCKMEKVPVEVLEKVFEVLPRKDRKSGVLVNSLWLGLPAQGV